MKVSFCLILCHLEALIISIGGIPAEVYHSQGAAREAQDDRYGVVIIQCCYLWSVRVNMCCDTARVFSQHPAHDVYVMYSAVVEDSTCKHLNSLK